MRNGRYIKPPSELRSSEIREAMASERDFDRRADLRVEGLRRWVFPFAALTFTLIGIPFGIVTRTSGKGIGLAISFLLILAYFGLLEWGSAVALTGTPLTPLAMWSPNVVLGSVGFGMLWWVARR
jgi:lipopolysaccharide export LptBFGC system permease protein LptF